MEVCSGSCCDEPEDDEDLASSSSSTTQVDSQRGPAAGCCCCYYDPFDDDSPESKIQDLDFALRKLSAMKCQMRKWRLERLELESQARTLRLALREYGVDVDTPLRPDPLLAHLRAENARLTVRRDELEDEVRDLTESLAERDGDEGDNCAAVACARERVLAVRQRCAVEKRRLRETIANLQVTLQEAREDSSCAALNRLRAKLRELMKDGEKGDQQVSSAVEKSIESMVELSKSCDEFRRENERLLAEVETLKCEIKDEGRVKSVELQRDSSEISELSSRVKTCESLVAQMSAQLAERDAVINELENKLYAERRNSGELERDLDQMVVSRKALEAEIETMKAELREKDEKVKQLLRDLRHSTTVALGMGELEAELERVRPELRAAEEQNEQLMDELSKARQELSERNDQVIRLLEERNSARAEGEATLEEARRQLLLLDELRKRNAELEAELENLSELDVLKAQMEDMKMENERMKNDTEKLDYELKRLQLEHQSLTDANNTLTNELSRASGDVTKLASESSQLALERDELRRDVDNLQRELRVEAQALEEARAELATVTGERDELAASLRRCESEGSKEREELLKRLKNLENELTKLQAERDTLRARASEASELAARATDLEERNYSLREKNEELTSRLNGLQAALEEARAGLRAARDAEGARELELRASRQQLDDSTREADDLRREIQKLRAAGDNAANRSADLESQLSSLLAENARLVAETEELGGERTRLMVALGRARGDAETASKDAENCQQKAAQLQTAATAALADKDRLEREVGDLKWQLERLRKEQADDTPAKDELQRQLQAAQTEVERLKAANADLLSQESEPRKAGKQQLSQTKERPQKQQSSQTKERPQKQQPSQPKERSQKDTELDECRAENDRLRRDIEKLTGAGGPREKGKLDEREREKTLGKTKDADELALASKVLRRQMQKQIAAVNQLRELMSSEGGTTKKKEPETLTELSASGYDSEYKWSAAEIARLVEKSRELSGAILKAVQEAQRLAELRRGNEKEKAEPNGNADNFNPNTWLQSLTMTELAELHERICLLTASIVQKNECADEALNARIAALQQRIAEKQCEAAQRAEEMRRVLMIEQAQLARLEMNLQRECNLNLPFSVAARALPPDLDVSCCNREDCARACCTTGDFNAMTAHRK